MSARRLTLEPPLELDQRDQPPPPAPDDPQLRQHVVLEEVDRHAERLSGLGL